MTDLPTKLAQLEALRPTLGDTAVDAAIAALRAEHAARASQVMRAEKIEHARQVVAEHYYEAPADSAEPARQRALRSYLEQIAGLCDTMQLTAIDPQDAAHTRPLQLSSVYIELHTTAQVPLDGAAKPTRRTSGDEREHRPLSAVEALCRAEHRRLMLLGAPGSGKSSFVSHLALCLAGAALAAQASDAPQPEVGWLARLPGWDAGPLLPVRVILRDLAAFAPLSAAPRGSLALLRAFLAASLAESGCAEAEEALLAALAEGRAILLLDGLDEVVGSTALQRVAETILAAGRAFPRSPLLVTCRSLDYEAERLRQLPGVPTQTLADLTDEQIARFVAAWYAELAASGRRTAAQATDDTRALSQAIAAQPELRELARLPLLLTVMALVHTNKGALPDARALLYKECIDLLLLRWRQPQGEPDLLARLGLPQFRSSDLLTLMAGLGFAAHEAAERDPKQAAVSADLNESHLIALLAAGFAQYDATRKHALAELVLEALAQRNGLLLQRGPGVYAFPHRTFQEFLAGYHLLRQRDYQKRCLERAAYPHWREALLLMVGYQVLEGADLERPLGLVERLIERSPHEQALAGEILLLIGRERAATYDPALLGREGLWATTWRCLGRLAFQSAAPAVPAPLRARAGLLCGQLGYGALAALSQPDASIPLPDPRLPLALLDTPYQRAPGWQRLLESYWCPVAAGAFWHGDDQAKQALQQLELPYAFNIARFPVTNAEYARFIAEGGYAQKEWWTPEGWKLLQPGGHEYDAQAQRITLPRYWREARLNEPTQPVVGVSWYEAAAYAIWLTAQGHANGWLPMDSTIRLPTSLEWERAARHTDKRRYPWGDEPPTPERANYAATAIKLPSPVGCFPAGVAVCGAEDLLGNVRQWMATPYKSPEQLAAEEDFTPNTGILMSYGDFSDDLERLSCGSRDWGIPYIRFDNLGIRLVWS
mgnify:CR=1 FL=1